MYQEFLLDDNGDIEMNSNCYHLGLAVCEEVIAESEVPKVPEMSQMVKDPKIKRFISLSKKILKNGRMSTFERSEMTTLLDDPKVRAYLQASQKVGQRIGWIQGGSIGALSGGLLATAKAGLAGLTLGPAIALALLGAIAGGISVGYVVSKIKGILRRWKTEEEITKGGLAGGTIFQM